MRKLAILAVAIPVLLAAARPAAASRCGSDCLPWLTPIAVGLGAGVVGLYAYGTAVYVAGDLDDSPKDTNYHGSELIIHGSLGSLFVGATVDAAKSGSTTGTLVLGSFAALHLTLATNGLRGLARHRDEFHPSDTLVTWTAGTLTGVNALYWASGMAEHHGRGYGIAEVAINAPLVAGFAYLARDRFEQQRGGPALGYAALAALSGVYVAHGAKTIMFPRAPKLDLLGTDLAPTVVSDGNELAPGVGTAGSF